MKHHLLLLALAFFISAGNAFGQSEILSLIKKLDNNIDNQISYVEKRDKKTKKLEKTTAVYAVNDDKEIKEFREAMKKCRNESVSYVVENGATTIVFEDDKKNTHIALVTNMDNFAALGSVQQFLWSVNPKPKAILIYKVTPE